MLIQAPIDVPRCNLDVSARWIICRDYLRPDDRLYIQSIRSLTVINISDLRLNPSFHVEDRIVMMDEVRL